MFNGNDVTPRQLRNSTVAADETIILRYGSMVNKAKAFLTSRPIPCGADKSMSLKFDLVKTIYDNDEVPDYSDKSDEEMEYQPTKKKVKNSREFDSTFEFVGSTSEYNHDHWNDVAKYIKRKAKRKTDDKIELIKKNKKKADEGEIDDVDITEGHDEYELSDEDLKKDKINTKEAKKKKKKEKTNLQFTDEISAADDAASFYQMNLSRPILKAIAAMNFVRPTPIQAATIPVALLGRDICGCAATGTGKTAAYMLPILERLLYRPQGGLATTRVLVLVPTRELGVQVYQVTRQLAQFTTVDVALSVGGLDVKVQEANLRRQPDVVIATPGRLIDHIKNTPSFSLDSIEVLVLDEADRMLDEYFAEQMKEIVKQCSRTRQTLLFSATMTTAVEDLASVSLSNPVKVFVDSNQNVAFNLRQEFVRIRKDRESDREAILGALVCRTFRSHCIIFVQTKKQAHTLHILLGLLNVKVGELHGNLRQPQRLDALKRFRDGVIDILVATDVAARGLDIVGVRTVINFVLPATMEHYIHRVGRTARAGRSGVSVSLAGEGERKLVKEIVKNARNTVKSRVIPQDILDRYKAKVEALQPDLQQVLKEEEEERQLEKTEKQLNRAENLIKGATDDRPREWFQSKKQRSDEKARLKLEPAPTKNKRRGKKKADGTPGEVPKQGKKKTTNDMEDRANNEVSKMALLQARLAKKKSQLKKIRCINDVAPVSKAGNKLQKKIKPKSRSSFEEDLTNVSRKKVKGLRYESNKHKKMAGKKGGGKFNKKTKFNKKK